MKVLVLGGSGYIGSRVCSALASSGWATPVSASARRATPGVENLRVDARDATALAGALKGIDAVVNCVAGDAGSIASGARALAGAALATQCPRIVHLSTMSVYGAQEGVVTEQAGFDPSLGWYARAKCEAELCISSFAHAGGTAVILRPGCVWGPGSELWVGRIGRWLRAGRLGDLGVPGDGWSNLVHVDDVCAAVVASLRLPQTLGQVRTYNLAAPDSPRWNEYFVDLALAIGATPVKRILPLQLKADAFVLGPLLKVAQMALSKVGRGSLVPDPVSPGLLGLWGRHLQLDSRHAERELGLQWTPYDVALRQCALWFLQCGGTRVMPKVTPPAAFPADGTS